MTDHEKDREAVEWAVRAAESAATPPYPSDGIATLGVEYMRVVAALAREALAMRERGPVGWVVVQEGESVRDVIEWEAHPHRELAESDAIDEGGHIIPLYAGEPVEVSGE